MERRPKATALPSDESDSVVMEVSRRPVRDIEPFERLEGCVAATAGNCVVNAWSGRVNVQALARIQVRVQAAVRANPGGIAMLVALLPNIPLANGEERAQLGEFYRANGPHFRGVASVVLGDGFWASAVRGVLTALHVVGTRPYPARVFASTRAAADWFEELPGFTLSEPNGVRVLLERLSHTPMPRMSFAPGSRRSMPP